jgi:hypothetical protein
VSGALSLGTWTGRDGEAKAGLNHSATLTAEQIRQDQDVTDLEALFATDRATYLNHIQTWDAKSTANKLVAAKEMFTIIGKVLRVFIRRNRDGGGAN